MRKRGPILAPAILLLAAACGGCESGTGISSLQGQEADGGASSTATAVVGSAQAALDSSQCMRDHGIDVPDPVFSENGGVTLMGPHESTGGAAMDPSDPEFQEAQEACQELFGGDGPGFVIGRRLRRARRQGHRRPRGRGHRRARWRRGPETGTGDSSGVGDTSHPVLRWR